MKTLWGDSSNPELNEALASWCAQRLGLKRGFRDCSTMGVFDGADLVAVMVYHNFDREAGVIEISGAGITPRWLTRPVLREMFGYPFEELNCQTVVMRVSEKNTRLVRILTAYGFGHVLIPRLRGRREAELVFFLHDDIWRANGFHTMKEAA